MLCNEFGFRPPLATVTCDRFVARAVLISLLGVLAAVIYARGCLDATVP
jgi:hypothetical protein